MELNVTQFSPKLTRSDASSVVCDVLESHKGLLHAAMTGAPLPRSNSSSQSLLLDTLLIMHPGNPGVVFFYDQFVLNVARRAPQTGVLVLGFAGHSLTQKENINNNLVFTLQDQIEAADSFYRTVILPLVSLGLIQRVFSGGHSIGAYVSLHMSLRFDSFVAATFQLTPTIMGMARSPNGQRSAWGLHPWVVATVSTAVLPVLAWLPDAVQQAIVSLAEPGMTAPHRKVVKEMAKPSILRNILGLARTEFEQVKDLDVAMLKGLGKRAILFCTHNDGWVPLSDIAEIQVKVPEVEVHIEHNRKVLHAWCCYSPELVAEFVAQHIRSMDEKADGLWDLYSGPSPLSPRGGEDFIA